LVVAPQVGDDGRYTNDRLLQIEERRWPVARTVRTAKGNMSNWLPRQAELRVGKCTDITVRIDARASLYAHVPEQRNLHRGAHDGQVEFHKSGRCRATRRAGKASLYRDLRLSPLRPQRHQECSGRQGCNSTTPLHRQLARPQRIASDQRRGGERLEELRTATRPVIEDIEGPSRI